MSSSKTSSSTPQSPLYNFYAIVGELSEAVLRKVRLASELQLELSTKIEEQRRELLPEGVTLVPFEPAYQPDAGEVFELSPFTLPPHLAAAVPSAPAVLPLVEEELDAGLVHAFVGILQVNRALDAVVCFQGIDARQVLRRARFSLLLANERFERSEHTGLVLRDRLTAIYERGTLYFPAELPVRRFLDLAGALRDATDEDLAAFLGDGRIHCPAPDRLRELVDPWMRRKIASIRSRNVLTEVTPHQIQRIAKDYGVTIDVQRNRGQLAIVLPTDKQQAKAVLRVLDQDFLDSRLTRDRFQVSSKRRLPPRVEARASGTEPTASTPAKAQPVAAVTKSQPPPAGPKSQPPPANPKSTATART